MQSELIALDKVHCTMILETLEPIYQKGISYAVTNKFIEKFNDEISKDYEEDFSLTILKSEFDTICKLLQINPLDPNEYEKASKKLESEIDEYLDQQIKDIDLKISQMNASESNLSFEEDEISPLFNSDPTIPYKPVEKNVQVEQQNTVQQVSQQQSAVQQNINQANGVPIISANNNENK